jgi:hypothetical protein
MNFSSPESLPYFGNKNEENISEIFISVPAGHFAGSPHSTVSHSLSKGGEFHLSLLTKYKFPKKKTKYVFRQSAKYKYFINILYFRVP